MNYDSTKSLEECMALHDADTNVIDSPDSSSWWDSITNGVQNFIYENSDTIEKAATDAANKEASNQLNKLLGGGSATNGNKTNQSGASGSAGKPAPTSVKETAKEFISTPTGAGVIGASVATGTYIAIPKKNKHRLMYSVIAGALAGAGTYYATKTN